MGKKKEKITYVDDGRTLADMSGVSGGITGGRRMKSAPRSTRKEQWETYKAAVKMMFGPMLVVICAIVIIYMVMWFLFTFF